MSTATGAIAAYVEQMWPELILLNQAYPEPPPRLIRQIARQGVAVFHLAGVEGRVHPSLPLGYDNAVPCCAVHDAEAVGEVRLERLG